MRTRRQMRNLVSRCLLRCGVTAAVGLLGGCAAVIEENHHFAAFRDNGAAGREAVQFYRVKVQGNSQFANARYLTGYFDERAVSLFFNEMRSPANGKLFDDNTTLPGSGGTKVQGLSPAAGEGAFVLIMSTNVDAIASTIGSFAESQVVADSLTRMLNRDRFQAKIQSDARLSVRKAEATALVGRVDAQVRAAKDASSGEAAAASYRRALTALAQSLGYTGAEFISTAEAQAWYSLDASRPGVAP